MPALYSASSCISPATSSGRSSSGWSSAATRPTDSFAQVLPDTAVSVNMLIGDTNGNKAVSASDVAQTKGQSGATVTAANFRTDINANGSVSASDGAQVKANAGHTLP